MEPRGHHPARRRRGAHPEDARPRPARARATRSWPPPSAARGRSGSSPSGPSTCSWSTTGCPERTGLELIRELAAAVPEARAAADRHDDRPRHRRERHRGHEARGLRLPAEALRGRRAAGRRCAAPSSTSACARQHRYLLSEREEEFNHYGIVGQEPRDPGRDPASSSWWPQSKSTVLITGETGTGKELAARAIHDRSAQREMPLIKVNCAAIPETLLESELFGHVRGAFTGATANKKGKFALADGGTHLPRRDRHPRARPPGQAAARPPGARVRAPRRRADAEGRRAGDRRHQPRPARDGGGRAASRRTSSTA